MATTDRRPRAWRRLTEDLRTYNYVLDLSCHKRLGISMALFRLVKLAVNGLGLAVAWSLVDMGGDPTLGLVIVFMIFGGGEIVETYLAESGFEDLRRTETDETGSDSNSDG